MTVVRALICCVRWLMDQVIYRTIEHLPLERRSWSSKAVGCTSDDISQHCVNLVLHFDGVNKFVRFSFSTITHYHYHTLITATLI